MTSVREVIAATIRQHRYSSTSQEQAHAILRALEVAGFVVVPVDATLTTIKEGWKQMPSLTDRQLRCIWRAMVAAAGSGK